MTEKMIENRVKKLQELEAQIEALEAAADAVRDTPPTGRRRVERNGIDMG